MNPEFWLSRWEEKQIGFHQETVNEHLRKFWSRTKLEHGSHVLVPLCGKSKDMLWLCEMGHNVTGVELSEIALKEFCAENCIEPHVNEKNGSLFCHVRPDFSLICSDFFNITPNDIGKVDAVYDRASIVALPPEMRKKYVRHIETLLPAGGLIFLIAFEYDQTKMQGPPFSVPEKEVHELFDKKFSVEHVYTESVKTLANRISSPVDEKIYLLTKK